MDTPLDTGQKVKQKKFVSTKQKIEKAKKLAKQRKQTENGVKVAPKKRPPPTRKTPTHPTIASPLILDNDPLSITNSTFGSANRLPLPPNTSSEVRRPGWNRPVLSMTVSPLNVFGANHPSPPPSRNIQMLKIGLGVLGGIALLLGSLASILYISKKRRREKKQTRNRKNRSDRPPPDGQSPHNQYPHPHPMHPGGGGGLPIPQCSGEYSQYPPNGWQNALTPYGVQNYAPNNYSQLPYGQIPNAAYYGMQYDPYGGHYQIAPGFYPQMAGYGEMGQNPYGQYPGQYPANVEYPESQGGVSEVGFDPVLNYVETLGDELKTPKRKPKQRKDGSSTPHPIITRRASCKSFKSEVSVWTEDEETASKAESTYVTQENVSLKGSHSGKEETKSEKCKLDGDSTKSSPQLSQTNDSAYGSRGSIQSPNSGPLVIPPFATGKVPVGCSPVQNVSAPSGIPVVPQISQYMVDPFNRKMVTMSGTVSQYSSNGQIQQTQLDSNFNEDS